MGKNSIATAALTTQFFIRGVIDVNIPTATEDLPRLAEMYLIATNDMLYHLRTSCIDKPLYKEIKFHLPSVNTLLSALKEGRLKTGN